MRNPNNRNDEVSNSTLNFSSGRVSLQNEQIGKIHLKITNLQKSI
jgi:hypothetical protein